VHVSKQASKLTETCCCCCW